MADKGIHFENLLVYSHEPVFCIQDAVESYVAFADIHKTSFDDLVDESFADLDNWAVIAGDWSASAGVASASGGGPQWNVARVDVNLDRLLRDGEIHITKYDDRGGVVFRMTDDDNYFLAWWDDSYVGISQVVDGIVTDLNVLPTPYLGEAEVEVAFRESRYTTLDDDYWMFGSMYIDGALAISAGLLIDEDDAPGTRCGLAVYPGDEITYSDLHIPELGRPTDWTSLESGQAPYDALQPILEYINHRMVVQPDGTVRVWIPKPSDVMFDVTDSDVYRSARELDRRAIVTHFRQIGTIDIVDVYDDDLIQEYGHQFGQGSNPNLINKFQCDQEGRRMIQQILENADRSMIEGPAILIMEKEDVVDTPDGVYIVDSVSLEYRGGDDAAIVGTITARKYVYGA